MLKVLQITFNTLKVKRAIDPELGPMYKKDKLKNLAIII